MKVKNGSCIRHLSFKTLMAARKRNIIAVLAIALTALLFTSLFTIVMSINETNQNYQFRSVGGYAHGAFKDVDEDQIAVLSAHPDVKAVGVRTVLGLAMQGAFEKDYAEVSYMDDNNAKWSFSQPTVGRTPKSGNEITMDTKALELLGVKPELGAQVKVTYTLADKEQMGWDITDTFTLVGWWDYDELLSVHFLNVSKEYAQKIDKLAVAGGLKPFRTDLSVMLRSSLNIENDLTRIGEDCGYSIGEEAGQLRIGVNWGYTATQVWDTLGVGGILAMLAVLILVAFTGYLVIYNIFQISVAGDIRFYGLLKTIGTTPRQLRWIIRTQALLLSLIGIPIGLLLGWLLGGVLTPVITARLNGVTTVVSVSPLLFVGAAIFALVTVLISCRRPGRLAGKVSPVEAVRYTEGKALKRNGKRSGKGVSLLSMAWANLGRSRGKTLITVLSLTLAVVLLTLTVTFAGGFDMDKYVSNFTASDFILADAGQFQTGGHAFNDEMEVPEEVIDAVEAQGGITGRGRIYGKTAPALEFVTEEYYRSMWGRWNTQEQLDSMVAFKERTEDGLLDNQVQLYGMEPFALDHLKVLEGDLSKLNDPDGSYIAAVYSDDDYGNPEMDSHWARLGDTVTIRYVEKFEYYDPATGEVYGPLENVPEGAAYAERAIKYRDVDYTVAALVTVPFALSYRYYGADEFVMGADTFVRETGTDSVMYYAFDTTEEANAAMESFLADYTENGNPQFDYESKATYAGEFESTRSMFLLLGGALSFIVGMVGVLNFFNAIFTGITARRRELAVLQSIGMTARQLRTMLALEGLLYTLGAALLALALILVTAPFVGPALNGLIWFFTYHFTIWPIAVVLPLFGALGILIPVLSSRAAQRYSVVERLRQE